MKTRYTKLAAVVLLIVGTIACDKETDMSDIDFSNIEDLYAKPLPVIQKAIQGKWKVYAACGGFEGCSYPENCFREYTNSQVVWNDELGNIYNQTYRWDKIQVPIYENTYAMFENTENTDFYGAVFTSIVNDTLHVQSWNFKPYYYMGGSSLVRVKDDTLSFEGYKASNFYRVTKIK